MKRYRRLRRLVPDAELVQRRAAGETLRKLAADYGVAHTSLGRYFARPDAARQLRKAGRVGCAGLPMKRGSISVKRGCD